MFPDITKCPLGGESVPSLSTTGVWNKAEGDKPLSLSLPRTCQKKFCRAGNSCEMREEEGNVCLCVCGGEGWQALRAGIHMCLDVCSAYMCVYYVFKCMCVMCVCVSV